MEGYKVRRYSVPINVLFLDELKRELATGNSSFREEIERNTLNGETFDVRFARVKNEVENSFKDAVKTESEQVC